MIEDFGRCSCFARNASNASLAAPLRGGEVRRIFRALSKRPAIVVWLDRGWTRTVRWTPSSSALSQLNATSWFQTRFDSRCNNIGLSMPVLQKLKTDLCHPNRRTGTGSILEEPLILLARLSMTNHFFSACNCFSRSWLLGG